MAAHCYFATQCRVPKAYSRKAKKKKKRKLNRRSTIYRDENSREKYEKEAKTSATHAEALCLFAESILSRSRVATYAQHPERQLGLKKSATPKPFEHELAHRCCTGNLK